MTFKNAIFYDKKSLILFFGIFTLACMIAAFLIFLSVPSAFLGIGLLLIIMWKINLVIYINDYLNVYGRFFTYKKIPISQVVEIGFRSAGFGSSRDTIFTISYNENESIKNSILLNYKVFGTQSILSFLNKFPAKEKINIVSLQNAGIKYKDGKYVKA